MEKPSVVSQEQWTAARKGLLEKEKELTRLRDEVSRERREMPWVRIEKSYVFEGLTARRRWRICSRAAAS
jgi:predicted dithiol-disulfide oxidoreductase (DUF899 family)